MITVFYIVFDFNAAVFSLTELTKSDGIRGN